MIHSPMLSSTTRRGRRRASRLVALLASSALSLWACGDDDPMGTGGGGGASAGGGGGAAAGGGGGSTTCEGPPGLYEDDQCAVIASDLELFQPRYVLWSDGAAKERYVRLPAGETIDTTNPDDWVFPVGTVFFKTFSLDGVKLETRILTKTSAGEGFGSWTYVAYAWNQAQDAVTLADPTNGEDDVLGTEHDIPSQDDCLQCHAAAARDMGLGFSAIQLNHDLPGVSLEGLRTDTLLSTDIDPLDATVPGTGTQQEALGYMHANCGHCHGGAAGVDTQCTTQSADGASGIPGLRMRVLVEDTNIESTDLYETAVNVDSKWPGGVLDTVDGRIVPGSPSTSAVYLRANRRGTGQMPPLATEQVNDSGVALIEALINSL